MRRPRRPTRKTRRAIPMPRSSAAPSTRPAISSRSSCCRPSNRPTEPERPGESDLAGPFSLAPGSRRFPAPAVSATLRRLQSAGVDEMTDHALEAARLLIEAHRTGRPIDRLPEALRPVTIEDAYAIQDHVTAALGAIGGWKVGQGGPTGPISIA